MQLVHDGAILIGHSRDVEGIGARIDHRGSGHAHLGTKSGSSARLAGGNWGDPVGWGDEAFLPERAESLAVCVECIDAIVFGSNEEHVTGDTVDGEIRNVKR